MSAALEARIIALERQVAALSRRRSTPFALARSTLPVNDDGAVQTIQAQLDPLSVRDNIPLLYNYGFTASPPIGADIHVTFIDGDRSKAVAVASGHQTYRLRGLAAGDSAMHDVRGATVWLTPTGPVINGAGKPATVVGDLHVTGQVYANFGGAAQVGLASHRHGSTSAPTPGT